MTPLLICTLKCSRRRVLRILLPVLFALLCLLALFLSRAERGGSAETDAQGAAYLVSLGWEVEAEPLESLSLTLADPLTEPYLSYNVLQQSQGLDLRPYCGKTLERRTYAVRNHPSGGDCRADLYFCGGELVAGNILCTGENGFLAPLAFPKR